MHLILTGATGLVGSGVLQHMLTLQTLTKISILSRRPVPMAEGHSQVQVIIHHDYTNYGPEVLEQLRGAEGCVWAQGISVNDVSKEEYVKITHDYPLAAARAFSTLSSPFKFVYVSGEGANTTPGMMTPYFGKIKGKAEAALLKLSKDDPRICPYSLRPAMVDHIDHPEIHAFIPQKKGMVKNVEVVLAPALRWGWKNGVSPTRDLGRILTDLALGDGGPLKGEGIEGEGRTITNRGFRRLAGL